MGTFAGSDFEIEVPVAFTDESTYVFAFPSRGAYRPSVAVKSIALGEDVALAAYAAEQLAAVRGVLPDVEVLTDEGVDHKGMAAHVTAYLFGEEGARMRQEQRYIRLAGKGRIVTLTATVLLELYPQAKALLDAVVETYRSLPGKGEND
jgi:hypothetical protein